MRDRGAARLAEQACAAALNAGAHDPRPGGEGSQAVAAKMAQAMEAKLKPKKARKCWPILRTLAFVATLLVATTTAHSDNSDTTARMLGTWGCTVQHMAGIQTEKGGKVYSGQIKPSVRYFILTIRKPAIWQTNTAKSLCTGKIPIQFVADTKPNPLNASLLVSAASPHWFVGGGAELFGCTSSLFITTKGTFWMHRLAPLQASYSAVGVCKKLK